MSIKLLPNILNLPKKNGLINLLSEFAKPTTQKPTTQKPTTPKPTTPRKIIINQNEKNNQIISNLINEKNKNNIFFNLMQKQNPIPKAISNMMQSIKKNELFENTNISNKNLTLLLYLFLFILFLILFYQDKPLVSL
jgi:hypothetical protein